MNFRQAEGRHQRPIPLSRSSYAQVPPLIANLAFLIKYLAARAIYSLSASAAECAVVLEFTSHKVNLQASLASDVVTGLKALRKLGNPDSCLLYTSI
ncbi:hypothetical protein, partial [Pseudomonas syringae]|uniref:hypothetical protein n=1 Tax=Pseudomonas syringae TaxID=317 RepID=UPI001F2B089B